MTEKEWPQDIPIVPQAEQTWFQIELSKGELVFLHLEVKNPSPAAIIPCYGVLQTDLFCPGCSEATLPPLRELQPRQQTLGQVQSLAMTSFTPTKEASTEFEQHVTKLLTYEEFKAEVERQTARDIKAFGFDKIIEFNKSSEEGYEGLKLDSQAEAADHRLE